MLKGKLVHADLSPFNILNHEEKPVIIDFSQTTTLDAPPAAEYFERDLYNINTYFAKHGLDKELKTPADFPLPWKTSSS